jgi:S-DNA-T family DNA segregation ATPase FtsK/SpoIIIE
MPALVKASGLPPHVGGLPVLGIDGISLEPRGFELDRPIMIAGQAGTGRTSAMSWLATSIARTYPKRRIVHLTQRRTSIGDLKAWNASFAGASAGEEFLAAWGAELEKSAEGDDQVIVCIENVQDFGASMSDGPLVQAIKQARRMGHLIIGEADIQGWITGQLVSELKGARRGLLLAPEGADAQMLFSAAAPRISRADMPPGRGVWIESGRVAMVQIPWVDGQFSPESDGPLVTAADSR